MTDSTPSNGIMARIERAHGCILTIVLFGGFGLIIFYFYKALFESGSAIWILFFGTPLVVGLLWFTKKIGSLIRTWSQARRIRRYTQPYETITGPDDLPAAQNHYLAQPDSPEKYTILGAISISSGDLAEAETYLRTGVQHLKATTDCQHHSLDLFTQWRCMGVHMGLFSLLLNQGRFIEAAEYMRDHTSEYPRPNMARLLSAWSYFLADDKSQARAVGKSIRPIAYEKPRDYLIIRFETKDSMPRETAIDLDYQSILLYLVTKLAITYPAESIRLKEKSCTTWDEFVTTFNNPYADKVRDLLPEMHAVWDAFNAMVAQTAARPD